MVNASKMFLDYYPYGRAEFNMTVSDVKKLDEEGQNSDTFSTGDIDWHLNVCLNPTKKGNQLSAYLFCNVDIINAWKVDGQFRIVLENKLNKKQSIARQMEFQFKCETDENRGWSSFVAFDDVLNKRKGFLVNGGISFRVLVGVNAVEGFDSPKYYNHTIGDGVFSDGRIRVDGFVFHVNKMMMGVHCRSIGQLLMDAEEGATVDIEDVDRHEFSNFLQLLYGVPIRIRKDNIASLLELSSRFEVTGLENMCEMFLQEAESTKLMTTADVLNLADEYDIPGMLDKVINGAKSAEELAEKFKDLNAFPPSTLKKVVSKTLDFA